MENVKGRKNFKLRTREAQMKLDTSKPEYLLSHEFTPNLILNQLMNLEVKLNKPIFIGQAVLNLSKLIMYELRFIKLPSYAQRFGARLRSLVAIQIVYFAKSKALTFSDS